MANVAENTTVPYRLLFVCSPNDTEELREIHAARADHITLDRKPGPGDYARKVNLGYQRSTEPYIFTGADDLNFHPGWDTASLSKMVDGIGVVGTNDLGNPKVLKGEHSTHSLVARWYADQHGTIDRSGLIYHPGYPHEFVDDEFCETARYRNMWAFAEDSIVEHLHPHWGKGSSDALYAQAPRRLSQGRRIYRSRQHLWGARPGKRTAPISVIVGTYGNESWRQLAEERALQSVDKQVVQPAEIIHVHGDDLAEARNQGALQATSPWLCFLDADDCLHSRYISSMSRLTNTSEALLNPAVQFVIDGKPQPRKMFKVRDLAQGNYLVIGTLITRDLFFRAGGFDATWEAYEDWQLWRKAVALGGRIVRVPQAIYIAHWNQEGRNNTIADKEGLKRRMQEEFDRWKESLDDRTPTHH